MAAQAAPPPARQPVSVLLLPVEAKGGANKETADTLTQMMAAEGGKIPGYKVVSFKEIEGTMSQEQVRQIAGCSSNACAAEIAGALNTDEIIMPAFSRVGDSYILTATRLRSRDAMVTGRISERFTGLDENKVLDRLPYVMQTLLSDSGKPPAATPTPAAAAAPPAATPETNALPTEEKRSGGRSRVLLGAGAVGLAGGGAILLVAAVAAVVGLLAFIPWLVVVPTRPITGYPRLVVLTGLPFGALVGSGVLLLASLAVAVAGVTGLGIGIRGVL